MKITNSIRDLLYISISALILTSMASGCAGVHPVTPESVMDNPEHHCYTGMGFIEQNKLNQAMAQFERAKSLDPKYPQAYADEGLVFAMQGNTDKAIENGEKGISLAKSNVQKANVYTTMIRMYTALKDKDWLDKAESSFNHAIDNVKTYAGAYYYMGEAYKEGFKFYKAGDMFNKVLSINDGYIKQANAEWKLVQKIQRAAPGTAIGKKIALADKLTRADAAALFVEELKLPELFKSRNMAMHDASFKTPEEAGAEAREAKVDMPTDTTSHPLSADIMSVLQLHIPGLSVVDGKFNPDVPLNRADYALMLQDILERVTFNKHLATMFIGSVSPFPDVSNTNYAFNAVMVCVTRGFMTARPDGSFEPQMSVSGADALLAIRRLKDALKIY